MTGDVLKPPCSQVEVDTTDEGAAQQLYQAFIDLASPQRLAEGIDVQFTPETGKTWPTTIVARELGGDAVLSYFAGSRDTNDTLVMTNVSPDDNLHLPKSFS